MKYNILHCKKGDFAMLTVDGHVYIGFITDLNDEENEADVTLLSQEIPSDIFT